MSKSRKKGQRIKINKEGIGTTLIDFAVQAFPLLGSKTATKKAIAKGQLLVNGNRPTPFQKLKKGDVLNLTIGTPPKMKKYEVDVPIIYEDDFLLIANKPGGIAVNGSRNKTLENALVGHNQNNPQADALPRPLAVHRIDVPTTGLVLVAKTKGAQIKLGKAFQNNTIKKEYQAIVHGQVPKQGQIDEPIAGKKALTNFELVESVPSRVFKYLSLVKLMPITGRTHQLRIHLNNKGHLIVGDKMYAEGQKTILGKGLLLCACRLQFKHPITEELLDIRIPPPGKFLKILQREKERYK